MERKEDMGQGGENPGRNVAQMKCLHSMRIPLEAREIAFASLVQSTIDWGLEGKASTKLGTH